MLFFKWHLIKAFSAPLLLYMNLTPPQSWYHYAEDQCPAFTYLFGVFCFLEDFSEFFIHDWAKTVCPSPWAHFSWYPTHLPTGKRHLFGIFENDMNSTSLWLYPCTSISASRIPPAFASPFPSSPLTPPSSSRSSSLWKQQKNLWDLGAWAYKV